MKSKFLIIILILSLLLAGCSNPEAGKDVEKESNNQAEEITESDEIGLEELETLGEIETEDGLLNVEMTFPPDFVGETTQEELNQLAITDGFISITLNDDGSATYIMTKNKHKKLLEETRVSFESSLEEMIGSSDYPEIVSIKANDNFTEFTVVTKNTELSFSESFSVISFYMMGGMYGIFSGEEVDDVNVKFVNESSGEIISQSNSNDMK